MNININVTHQKVENGDFLFGNIESDYGVNTFYFTREGKPHAVVCGELHFSRMDRKDWRQELLKMRANGINAVSTYVFWNYHEKTSGVFDFTGNKDIAAFLSICRNIGMPVVLRIGPWCHGEVRKGGFPDYIASMVGTRTNNPKYLNYVSRYFTEIYNQVSSYLDGKVVIGIQLENEYCGKIDHIVKLREICEGIGFKTPFFTMTAWPSNAPDKRFLPMVGGYPDAPWSNGKSRLKPKNRFAISPSFTEAEIGEDLNKMVKAKADAFAGYPKAACEIGPGNQVTQKRRPIITDKDAYGVAFAKLASGLNWVGYYMYHGGTNPKEGLYQESRRTFYPNNYPIIDYDFQSPISRHGYKRRSADRLRLMHYFITQFDPELVAKQAFFPDVLVSDVYDVSRPKISVRLNEKGEGYFFATTYERGLEYGDFDAVKTTVTLSDKAVVLPAIDISGQTMIYYPFNLTVDGVKFDYIVAEPIAKVEKDGVTTLYFKECESITPILSVDGKMTFLTVDGENYRAKGETGDIEICVLSENKAFDFYVFGDKVVFTNADVYQDNGELIFLNKNTDYAIVDGKEIELNKSDKIANIAVTPTNKTALPYNHYVYSHARRNYYNLDIMDGDLDGIYDIKVEFDFNGLNLQLFSDKKLIDDYFNTDGVYTVSLRQIEEYLGTQLKIRASKRTRFGTSEIFTEIDMPYLTADIKLKGQTVINKTIISL